jgi:hypothetical protein
MTSVVITAAMIPSPAGRLPHAADRLDAERRQHVDEQRPRRPRFRSLVRPVFPVRETPRKHRKRADERKKSNDGAGLTRVGTALTRAFGSFRHGKAGPTRGLDKVTDQLN